MKKLSEDRPCIKCGLSVPEVAFYYAKTRGKRRHSVCIECQIKHQNEKTKLLRRTDEVYREKLNKRARERERERRIKVIQHYSNDSMMCACQGCDISQEEFLTIDHINGGGTKHREVIGTGHNIYSWLIKNDYPEGFRVLCYNCNCVRGTRGYCPHEKPTLP